MFLWYLEGKRCHELYTYWSFEMPACLSEQDVAPAVSQTQYHINISDQHRFGYLADVQELILFPLPSRSVIRAGANLFATGDADNQVSWQDCMLICRFREEWLAFGCGNPLFNNPLLSEE
jgi:hypothetical protein